MDWFILGMVIFFVPENIPWMNLLPYHQLSQTVQLQFLAWVVKLENILDYLILKSIEKKVAFFMSILAMHFLHQVTFPEGMLVSLLTCFLVERFQLNCKRMADKFEVGVRF